MELGEQLYAIDEVKKNEIALHYEYEKEIKSLDVQSIEQILKYAASYEDDNALAMADLKDDVVSPLIREQYRLLALMREDIINGNIDAQDIQTQIQLLQKEAQHGCNAPQRNLKRVERHEADPPLHHQAALRFFDTPALLP